MTYVNRGHSEYVPLTNPPSQLNNAAVERVSVYPELILVPLTSKNELRHHYVVVSCRTGTKLTSRLLHVRHIMNEAGVNIELVTRFELEHEPTSTLRRTRAKLRIQIYVNITSHNG